MCISTKLQTICVFVLLFIGVLSSQSIRAQSDYSEWEDDLPIENFYDELDPYGDWIDNPEYGKVWVPNVEEDFQPYAMRGHWVMTDYGNTWVSDYPWGWAPFHYGRWFRDPSYGWVWVPGREWAPAWVTWRTGGGYYGWAPLGPSMSINVSLDLPFNYWCFVPQAYISSPYVSRYCIPRTRISTIYHHTTYINHVYRYKNRVYACGPRHHEIEYVTRQSIPVYRVNHVRDRHHTVVENGRIEFYRPATSNYWRNSDRPRRMGENRYSNNRREVNPLDDTAEWRTNSSGRIINPANRSGGLPGGRRAVDASNDAFPSHQSEKINHERLELNRRNLWEKKSPSVDSEKSHRFERLLSRSKDQFDSEESPFSAESRAHSRPHSLDNQERSFSGARPTFDQQQPSFENRERFQSRQQESFSSHRGKIESYSSSSRQNGFQGGRFRGTR